MILYNDSDIFIMKLTVYCLHPPHTHTLHTLVHLVLHPHGIAPTFLKLKFLLYLLNLLNKSDNEMKCMKKVEVLFIEKGLIHLFKDGCNSTTTPP